MWEDNLGKAKTRRSKNSKPYERPKSILRRVTDSVTGLLPQPSWLVNWLQSTSPKKEDAESEEVEEEQPVPSTSSESEANNAPREAVNRESFIFRRPPGANKEQSNGRTPVSNIPSLDLFPDPVIAEISREQLGQTNGDDDSNSESTSGCSSLLPHPEHKRDTRNVELPNLSAVEPLRIDQSSLQIIGSSLSKSLAVDLKSSRGRKTLSLHTFSQDTSLGVTPTDETRFHKGADGASSSYLDDTSLNRSASKRDISQPQLSAFSSKRPRFNITSFGPSAAEARRSLLNESVVDSPFYAGRTTYGGASAYRRATLQPSATLFPYVRKRIQARPSSISSAPPTPSGSNPTTGSSSVVLSSSAQRILQALEAMSTPVRDAKRIPTPSSSRRSTSMHEEDLSFSGFGLSRRRPNLGPPTTKLAVGTPAQIVSRPQPAVNKTELDTSKKPVSSTPISGQAGGKMRSRKTAPLRESAREAARIREEEEDEPITSDLQAVPMPIGLSSLPSFSLLPPPTVTTAVTSQPSMKISATSSNGLINTSTVLTTTAPRPAFTFSAPLVTVSPHEAAAAISSKPPSFNFSSPLLVKPIVTKTPVKETVIQQTEELKSGSVLEALSGQTQETLPVFKPMTEQPPILVPSGFGEKFKPPTDSWTCSVCCVTNRKDQSKCLACESPGPAAVSKPVATTTPTLPISKGFGDQFKMTASQWECSVCMVRNADKELRCKSCEEPKPGVKPVTTPSSVSSFKFGVQPSTAGTGMKFGMDSSKAPAASAEKPAENKELSFGATKKEEGSSGFKFGTTVETPKETTGFKFGSTMEPAKKTEAGPGGFKFGTAIESGQKAETPGFKFGSSLEPVKKPEETLGGFKFGADKQKDETTASQGTTSSVSSTPVESVGGLFSIRPAAESVKKPEEVKTSATPSTAPEEPVKKSEESQGFFKIPAVSTQGSCGLFNSAATTTTAASKSSPIFSFGTVPDSNKVTRLETGSVMDILGKKAVTTPAFGQPPVSSAPSFTFGASEPAKPSFSFTKPEAVAEKPVFSFGSASAATQEPAVTKSLPSSSATSTTTIAATATTCAPSLFSFSAGSAAPATSAPSLSLFKPSATTTTPFNFGPSTVFGASAPSTAAPAAPTFSAPTSTAPSAIPAFGAPTLTAPPTAFGIATTSSSAVSTAVGSTAPASSGSLFSFGAAPTPATTASTASTGGFSFGLAPTTSAPTPFAFGSSTAPPPYPFASKETSQPTGSGFGFSAPSTAASGVSAPAAPAVFAFGSSSAVAPTATTTPSDAPKLQFSFGTPQQTTPSTAAAPTFGSFGASASKTSTPFSFGASGPTGSTPAFGEMAPKSTATPFGSSTPFGSLPPTGFGAAPAAGSSTTPSFSFGAQSTAPTSAFSAAPSFNFGGAGAAPAAASVAPQQQPTGPVFQFGSAPTPAVNSSFSFGSSPAFTTPDAAPSPGFASGLFGSNPFDNTGSAGGPSRKIRKAVRRR